MLDFLTARKDALKVQLIETEKALATASDFAEINRYYAARREIMARMKIYKNRVITDAPDAETLIYNMQLLQIARPGWCKNVSTDPRPVKINLSYALDLDISFYWTEAAEILKIAQKMIQDKGVKKNAKGKRKTGQRA